MSLEAAIQENTIALRELTAALVASGALQTAQTSSAAASSPAVQAVTKAQKALADKEAASKPASANVNATEVQTRAAETKAAEPAAAEKKPWAEKTAAKFAELQGQKATVENLKKGIIAINGLVSREQAEAVLSRFGADAVTEKPGKKHLDESQYVECFGMMLRVLAGAFDATESEVAA